MTQAFNLSQFANKVNTSGQADLTTAVTGTLPVANGGTGATTLTSGDVLIGAGTGAVTSVAAGASGNVLTSNGTTWTSAASGGGQYRIELFTAPGTWTKPASCTQVKVTVIGGGAGATPNVGSGKGGLAIAANVPVTAPVTVTIGSGGGGGTTGGTSSFGPAVSATGGVYGPGAIGTPGTGTVSVGTALKVGSLGSGFFVANPTYVSIGDLYGSTQKVGTGPGVYSQTNINMAGANAFAPTLPSMNGVVLVEFVG
jgi:hypothetical protein